MKDFILLVRACEASASRVMTNKRGITKRKGQFRISVLITGLVLTALFSMNYANALFSMVSGGAPREALELFVKFVFAGFLGYEFFYLLVFAPYVYFQKDQDIFSSLPISGHRLFLARMVIALYISAVDGGLLFLVVGLITTIGLGLSPLAIFFSVLFSLLVTISLPFLSFAIAVVVRPLFRYPQSKTGTMVFNVIATVFATAFILFAMLSVSNYRGEGTTAEEILAAMQRYDSMTGFLGWVGYLPMKFLFLDTSSSWLAFVFFLAVSVLCVVLGLAVGKFLYINSMTSSSKGRKKKAISKEKDKLLYEKAFRRKPSDVLLRREFSNYRAYPFILSYAILMPFVIYLSLFISYLMLPEMEPTERFAFRIAFTIISLYTPYAAFASLSLEKSTIISLKSMPIRSERFVFYKMIPPFLYSLPIYLVSVLSFGFIGGFDLISFLVLAFVGLAFILADNMVSFFFGTIFYDFNFQNPAELLSHSWGSFFVSMVTLVLAGITVAVTALIATFTAFIWLGGAISLCLLLATFVAFCFLSIHRVKKLMQKDFNA